MRGPSRVFPPLYDLFGINRSSEAYFLHYVVAMVIEVLPSFFFLFFSNMKLQVSVREKKKNACMG